jgi:hypothetical protein
VSGIDMGAQDPAESPQVDPISQLNTSQQLNVAKRIWSWYHGALTEQAREAKEHAKKDPSSLQKQQTQRDLQQQLDVLKRNEGAFKANLRALLDWSKDPSLIEIFSPSTIDKLIADELQERRP